MGFFPATIAVFGMLADKDVHGVIDAVKARIDRWFVAPLPGPRGAAADAIRVRLEEAGVARSAIRMFVDIDAGFAAAREAAGEADRIIVFGSFLTVAAALAATTKETGRAPHHG
jgi:dihydrofolate synthase/folylpolyglutamate synthase